MNPFSENFILKDLLDYLNPFSDNFILKGLLNAIGTLLDYLNPFSENFIFKGVFDFIGGFFTDLGNFLQSVFIPTDGQWEDIGQDYTELSNTVQSHMPFISLFSDELRKAQEAVEKTDFLVITIPSFSYSGSGGIGVNTDEQRVINVGQAYEPYRAYVRSFLFILVVGLACVYLVKYILNYGDVSSVVSGIVKSSKGGGD